MDCQKITGVLGNPDGILENSDGVLDVCDGIFDILDDVRTRLLFHSGSQQLHLLIFTF